MLGKEKFYKKLLLKKIILVSHIILFYFYASNNSHANLENDLINELISTKTLSFNFIQNISGDEEVGNCFIKYPLLMKCNYHNLKKKVLISNGKKIAIIKKKYKKIYYYPLKSTPLFIILDKKKLLNLIKNTQPIKIDENIIQFQFIDKKSSKLNIFFNKKTLKFQGWETKDIYSNNVSFQIIDLKKNNQIVNDFFKIPLEEDL